MVPGWIAGRYGRDEGTVDLAGLAKRAGAELVLDHCIAIDPEARSVLTQSCGLVGFDVASIDTGGVGQAARILGDDPRLIDVRPIDAFVEKLDADPPAARIAVVGGGAGGVEIAFAMKNRAGGGTEVTLVAGKEGLLPDFSKAVRRKVRKELRRQGIAVIEQDAHFDGGDMLDPFDLVIAALGSGAPGWPRAGGLACDEAGFIAVDPFQRSTSHPHTYAIGDVASRQDHPVGHSGVHAVMAGPIHARNLRDVMAGDGPTRIYYPRPASLYLLSTGNGSAIASYGPFAAQGRWVARLKHWIDNRWVSQYATLASGA